MVIANSLRYERPVPVLPTTMKALVFTGPGQYDLLRCPKPRLVSTSDAIVKVDRTTICVTDLDIVHGHVPSCETGRILGHEALGTVEEVGDAVANFEPGDRVVISSVTRCGMCAQCNELLYSQCRTGGWLLGNEINGTHAEYVRVPHADGSLYHVPYGCAEEELLLLADVLPTVYECGVLNGSVHKGKSVAIIGNGVMGLAAVLAASTHAPGELYYLDDSDARLRLARSLGATNVFHRRRVSVAKELRKLTGGAGVDSVIEATGKAAAFATCESIVASGGTIANLGSHGVRFDLHLEKLWARNVTVTMGSVDGHSVPLLMRSVREQILDAKALFTHRLSFDRIVDAYRLFDQASERDVLKILIES